MRVLPCISLAAILSSGCLSTGRQQGALDQRLHKDVSQDRVRGAAFEFGRHAILNIEAVADSILQDADDPELRAETIRWMAFAVPNIREAILRPEPIVAFLDVAAVMMQYRRYFDQGDGRSRMGPYHDIVLRTHERLEEQVLTIARAGFVPVEGDTVFPKLRTWVETHPMVGANYLRESVAFAAGALAGERAEGALGAVGGMDESLRLLNERLRFMEEPLFKEVGWKAELMGHELFDAPVVKRAMAPVGRMAALADSLPILSGRVMDTAFARLATERSAVFDEIDRQRMITLQAVTGERAAVLAALSTERGAVVGALHEERVGTLRDLESMRRATIGDMRALIDHTLWRLLQLCLVIGAMLIAGALAVAWLLRRPASVPTWSPASPAGPPPR